MHSRPAAVKARAAPATTSLQSPVNTSASKSRTPWMFQNRVFTPLRCRSPFDQRPRSVRLTCTRQVGSA